MTVRLAPFDRWPVQHYDPHYGFAWYCGKGLVISHIIIAHGSEAAANAYHDFEDAVLRDHAAELAENGGLFAIHDWRVMETYEAAARQVWQERMQTRPKGYLRGSIVCVKRAGPLLRMAVQAANLVASLSQGAKVELTNDLDGALTKYGGPATELGLHTRGAS